MFRYKTSTAAAHLTAALFAFTNIFQIGWMQTHATRPTGPGAAGVALILNEVDADTPGTDVAELIELYDGGIGNTPLDGYVVVLFNGSATNDASYASFDLDGFSTNGNGYFTLGNSAVPGVDLIFANGGLQNGPDAVAIFAASASDFPNGTPITTSNIRDALVYNNGATVDVGLLALLNPGEMQVNENSTGNGTAVSMQRLPNGSGGERNTSTYQVLVPTPDAPNAGPTAAPISLSGRVTDSWGRAIRNAVVLLEAGGIGPRAVATGSMGYYNFDNIEVGTYTVTVNAKRHTFAIPSRTITMVDSVAGFDFISEPYE